jgi:hypothetical protein
MSSRKIAIKSRSGISRRDFMRGMALATATVAVPFTSCTKLERTTTAPTQPPSSHGEQLSAVGEAQVQAIFGKYGNRLSEEQKADIKRLVKQFQGVSDALRSFKLENSNEPSLIFRIYRAGGE